MKYCVGCGSPLDEDSIFCVYCGIRQPESQWDSPTINKEEKTVKKEELKQQVEEDTASGDVFGVIGLGLSLFAFVTAIIDLILSAAAHDMGNEIIVLMAMIYALANLLNSVLGIVFSVKSKMMVANTGKMLGFVSIGISAFSFIVALGAMA